MSILFEEGIGGLFVVFLADIRFVQKKKAISFCLEDRASVDVQIHSKTYNKSVCFFDGFWSIESGIKI